MPLDPRVPGLALIGSGGGQSAFNPLDAIQQLQQMDAYKAQADRYKAAAAQEQLKVQKQGQIDQILQQYPTDFDTAAEKITQVDPLLGQDFGKAIWAKRKEMASALQEQVKTRQATLAEGIQYGQMAIADPTQYPRVHPWMTQADPRLAQFLPPPDAPPEVVQQRLTALMPAAMTTDKYYSALQDAAQKLQERQSKPELVKLMAGLFATSETPELWQTTARYAAGAGLTGIAEQFGTFSPEAVAHAKTMLQTLGGKEEKGATLGSFEDYVARMAAEKGKTPDQLTTKEIEEARKRYQQADDRPINIRTSGSSMTPVEIKPNTAMFHTAQDMAYGKLTFGQFRTLVAYSRDPAMKIALYDKARELNPNFNPAAFEMGYKFAANPITQRSLAAIDNVLPNIDSVIDVSNALPRTDMPTINKWLAEGRFQLGDKRIANFRQMQKLIGDEIGIALGGGAMTDMKLKLGLDVVDPNLSPQQFFSNMERVREFLSNRKNSILNQMGPYGTPEMNPGARPVPGTSQSGPQEGDTKPIPGYPGTEQTYRNGKWIRTK